MCDRHQQELLATLPSASFPGLELLVVVALKEAALYEYLRTRLAGVKGVQVMMERRRSDRRRQGRGVAGERRNLERRVRRGQISVLGYTLVRFGRSTVDPTPFTPDPER